MSWLMAVHMVKAAAHWTLYGRHRIRTALIVAALSGALAACADQKHDATYYYFSDLPDNGHSRAYTYPTDITRGYTTYAGFRDLDTY
jgi:hypothetical protein